MVAERQACGPRFAPQKGHVDLAAEDHEDREGPHGLPHQAHRGPNRQTFKQQAERRGRLLHADPHIAQRLGCFLTESLAAQQATETLVSLAVAAVPLCAFVLAANDYHFYYTVGELLSLYLYCTVNKSARQYLRHKFFTVQFWHEYAGEKTTGATAEAR